MGGYCRDCGECQPCPQNLNVPATLRFYLFTEAFGLKNWVKKLCGGQGVGIDKCTGCRECEQKCPYRLPIMNMLKKAKMKLQ